MKFKHNIHLFGGKIQEIVRVTGREISLKRAVFEKCAIFLNTHCEISLKRAMKKGVGSTWCEKGEISLKRVTVCSEHVWKLLKQTVSDFSLKRAILKCGTMFLTHRCDFRLKRAVETGCVALTPKTSEISLKREVLW